MKRIILRLNINVLPGLRAYFWLLVFPSALMFDSHSEWEVLFSQTSLGGTIAVIKIYDWLVKGMNCRPDWTIFYSSIVVVDWQNVLDGWSVRQRSHTDTHTRARHRITHSHRGAILFLHSDSMHVFCPLKESIHANSKKTASIAPGTMTVTTAVPDCLNLNLWSREIWFELITFIKSSCLWFFSSYSAASNFDLPMSVFLKSV